MHVRETVEARGPNSGEKDEGHWSKAHSSQAHRRCCWRSGCMSGRQWRPSLGALGPQSNFNRHCVKREGVWVFEQTRSIYTSDAVSRLDLLQDQREWLLHDVNSKQM